MKLSNLIGSTKHALKSNSTTIFTALGVSGVVTTAYLTARATFKAAEVIIADESRSGTADTAKQRLKERAPQIWKFYIPPAISTVASVGFIIAAQKSGARKTAAAQAAFAVTERAFSEYREKVIEEFGEHKDRAVRDKIAQDRVDRLPENTKELFVTGPGSVLFLELFTGRPFVSDMETVRKAVNELNAKLLRNDYAYLDDFYHILGIPYTSQSGNLGWQSDKLLELSFSTTLFDNKPCITFDYNYVKDL